MADRTDTGIFMRIEEHLANVDAAHNKELQEIGIQRSNRIFVG